MVLSQYDPTGCEVTLSFLLNLSILQHTMEKGDQPDYTYYLQL